MKKKRMFMKISKKCLGLFWIEMVFEIIMGIRNNDKTNIIIIMFISF